jgi:hypothetical protein
VYYVATILGRETAVVDFGCVYIDNELVLLFVYICIYSYFLLDVLAYITCFVRFQGMFGVLC